MKSLTNLIRFTALKLLGYTFTTISSGIHYCDIEVKDKYGRHIAYYYNLLEAIEGIEDLFNA